MRTLYIVVGLLGLFLAGLGWSEYSAACDRESQIGNVTVQYMKREELKARQEGKGGVLFNILQSDYNLNELKRDSVFVVSFGAVFFIIGTAGVIMSRAPTQTRRSGDSLNIQ